MGTSKNSCFWAAKCDFEVGSDRRPRRRGAEPLSRLCGRGRPLQEGQSADGVHEVHPADLRLGSDETDRAHDLAAHAGVLMAEDVLDTRAPWTAFGSPLAPAAIRAFPGSPGGGCGFASP